MFIEVTGTDPKRVDASLKCLVWSFARYSSGLAVEQVEVRHPDGRVELTPGLDSHLFGLRADNIARIVGQPLDAATVRQLLQRMGLAVHADCEGGWTASVPFYRTDVLHEVDILEDIAIAFGYNRVQKQPLESRTVGREDYLDRVSQLVREELAIAGYNEVLTFALCSLADLTTSLNCPGEDKSIVRVANPKNQQFEAGRNTLKAGLLKALWENKMHKLPLRLFEVGDVMLRDEANETGSSNCRKVAAILSD